MLLFMLIARCDQLAKNTDIIQHVGSLVTEDIIKQLKIPVKTGQEDPMHVLSHRCKSSRS